MRAFTIPVKNTKVNADTFIQTTGCELFTLDEAYTGEGYTNIVSAHIEPYLKLVDLNEVLAANKPYFARCERPGSIMFEGPDPGAFETQLNPRGFTPVATRFGMMGKRIFELIFDCSNPRVGNTVIKRYANGVRNFAGKLVMQDAFYDELIRPGDFYFVFCGSSSVQRGLWDPSQETLNFRQVSDTTYKYRNERANRLNTEHRTLYASPIARTSVGQKFYYWVPHDVQYR